MDLVLNNWSVAMICLCCSLHGLIVDYGLHIRFVLIGFVVGISSSELILVVE